MGEAPPKFRGKNKAAITGDEVNPLLGSLQFERLVKRSIDFDGVEKLGQIRGLMEAARPPRGINETVPVRIRPSRGADAEHVPGGVVRRRVRLVSAEMRKGIGACVRLVRRPRCKHPGGQ